jgi:hypothetical protein
MTTTLSRSIKIQAFTVIYNYIAKEERQIALKVKQICSDNDGEFISKKWTSFIAKHGIEHIGVHPEAHTQIGQVDRLHLTILNGV